MYTNKNIPELSMAQKLKMFRELNNLSQEQLGQHLNVSDKTISAWENGERDISLPNAKSICSFFGIPESYFVFNDNFEKLDYGKQELVLKYFKQIEFRKKIEKIIETCKNKLKSDGLPVKKEYLPSFDYENDDFFHYGIFDSKSLPIKIPKKTFNIHTSSGFTPRSSSGRCSNDTPITFESCLDNVQNYKYDSSLLAKFELYDILKKCNHDAVQLKDLRNCNNIEIFATALSNMKSRKYIQPSSNPWSEGVDISSKVVQEQLNDVLENLNPSLSKYWAIIVFLIDNGAFYTKQCGSGDDVVCWSTIKDVSKTNLIYRLAKDHSEK